MRNEYSEMQKTDRFSAEEYMTPEDSPEFPVTEEDYAGEEYFIHEDEYNVDFSPTLHEQDDDEDRDNEHSEEANNLASLSLLEKTTREKRKSIFRTRTKSPLSPVAATAAVALAGMMIALAFFVPGEPLAGAGKPKETVHVHITEGD